MRVSNRATVPKSFNAMLLFTQFNRFYLLGRTYPFNFGIRLGLHLLFT